MSTAHELRSSAAPRHHEGRLDARTRLRLGRELRAMYYGLTRLELSEQIVRLLHQLDQESGPTTGH